MSTDAVARRVARKELRLFFSSPAAWLFLAAFVTVTLFLFFWVDAFFARNIADVRPLFHRLPVLLIFLCAALTMRMWSDERRSGTLEHVLTQPASLWSFVLGKFLACFILLLLALVSTVPLPVTVALIAQLDWGPVVAAYVAAALMGSVYLSAGLLVSARTDNAIVSLIGTVALGTALYLPGSDAVTNLVGQQSAELLRQLGTGARFENISRGVIDARDLFYYFSLTMALLALNVFVLEKQRWAKGTTTSRHRLWCTAIVLLLANLLVANIWLARIDALRMDVTQGRLHSLSAPSHKLIGQLQEPLLIRGYFSARTHPLLAPLVPQLRDLLAEYELAGNGRIRLEIIDPERSPALEKEANERYGIAATPVQIADRYQSSLVNAYFNVLVQYGAEYETLDFADLIEVRTAGNGQPEVLLRNPEYDISRALKDVLYRYRTDGNLFAQVNEPVEFIGYVSGDSLLPPQLARFRAAIKDELQAAAAVSEGKFSVRFIEPEARDGLIAQQIESAWGFRPMQAAPGDAPGYYFYLTLTDGEQVVQLPTADFDQDSFRAGLHAGLRRFAAGLTRTVALALPEVNRQMARFDMGGPVFNNLEQAITRNYTLLMEDLSDGSVAPEADILAVVAPHRLDDAAVLAIDQFLMRGGTVVLASSPYTAELSGGQLRLQDWDSGLQDWLKHHGVEIGDALVLDPQNAAFPAPVTRRNGDFEFQDVRMVDYPYFIDLRQPGLSPEHPITAGLPQLTMPWASPITLQRLPQVKVTRLLRSSTGSWLSSSMDIMPNTDAAGVNTFADGDTAWAPGADAPRDSPESANRRSAHNVGVILQGEFSSYYADQAPPEMPDLETERERPRQEPGRLLQRSPESARLVVYSSNDFMDDQLLNVLAGASGTQYLGALELFVNTLDWALQDGDLVDIRSRGHFNRTLPPLEKQVQKRLEYLNYAMALLWLILLALLHWTGNRLQQRRYRRELAL